MALTIAVAFVAIVVPTCRMVGCSMDMGAMGMVHNFGQLSFMGDCGGTVVASSAPSAVVPAGADALVLALVAAVFAGIALAMPRPDTGLVRVIGETPPPPPTLPRGERFRV